MASSRGKAASTRKFRSGVAKLKRAGLISADVDARSVQPTKAIKAKLRKYNDVVEGRATVVRAPTGRAAKVAADRAGFKRQGNLIVVPKHKGMRPKYDRGYVKAIGTTFGEHIRQTYIKPAILSSIPPPRKGFYNVYKVPFKQFGKFQQFASLESYIEFRDGYWRQGKYLDMDDQLIIEEVPIPDEGLDDE